MINYNTLYNNQHSCTELFNELNRIDDARRAIATLIGQAQDMQHQDCYALQVLMDFLQDHQNGLTHRLYQLYLHHRQGASA